jgi:hypothetical protein
LRLIEGNWKLIYREKAKEAGQHPGDVERMMTELGKWLDAQKQLRAWLGKGARSTMDQQTLEQLRSMGYIGGKK